MITSPHSPLPPVSPNTFSVVSLGCPKNLVDSEHYVFEMEKMGKKFRPDVAGSETVILNTCGFLHSARSEACEYIEALLELKSAGSIDRILVRGCMPQLEVSQSEGIAKLAAEFPGVAEWYGVPTGDLTIKNEAGRHLLTFPHVAYLRIADGCDRRCSFCTIPLIRGRFRSVPLENLLKQARFLASQGVKELVVIAQETTFWGKDLYGMPSLPKLLRELETVDGIEWIRLMYSYPAHFEDALIDLFAKGGKLLPYIDIPLQHASDEMLKKMHRRVTQAETEALLGKLREKIPNLVLRTSLIVGFPGETDAMFDELLRFVDRWKFERAGVFPFSAEAGTEAAELPNKIPQRVIERRFDRLYQACERHSTAWATLQKGRILNVRIDSPYTDPETGRKEPGVFIGRTQADAPDIDPVVFVTNPPENKANLTGGRVLACEILETEGCDLVGVALE